MRLAALAAPGCDDAGGPLQLPVSTSSSITGSGPTTTTEQQQTSSTSTQPAPTSTGSEAPPPAAPLRPGSLAGLAASLGLGLGAAAAAAPAGFALASLVPKWNQMDSNWRRNRWSLFRGDRRVTEIMMAVNVAVYGLQQMYPQLVFKLARVSGLCLGAWG